MVDPFSHLLQRHLEDQDVVRKLIEGSTQFRELAEKHHEISESLHRMPQAEQAAEAGERQRLEHQQRDLEEQLVLMINNATRV